MKMTNEQLEFIEKDLKLLIRDNFHPKHAELINILFHEDIKELIKFAKHVNSVLNYKSMEVSGSYEKGYWNGIQQIKREIYG